MMMQRSHSHACHFRKFLYTQRFRVIGPEPSDRFRCSVTLIARRGDRAQPLSLRSSKQAIHDLTLDQIAKERYVLGSVKKVQKPTRGLQQIDGRFPNRDATSWGWAIRRMELLMAENFPDYCHIEF